MEPPFSLNTIFPNEGNSGDIVSLEGRFPPQGRFSIIFGVHRISPALYFEKRIQCYVPPGNPGQNVSVFIEYIGQLSESRDFHYKIANKHDFLSNVKETKRLMNKRKREVGNCPSPEQKSKIQRAEKELGTLEHVLQNPKMYPIIENLQIEQKLQNLRQLLSETGIEGGQYGSNIPVGNELSSSSKKMPLTVSNNESAIEKARPRKGSLFKLFWLNISDEKSNTSEKSSIPHVSEDLEDMFSLKWIENAVQFVMQKAQTSPKAYINKLFENDAIKQEYANKLLSTKLSPILWDFNFQELPGPILLTINDKVEYENNSNSTILAQHKVNLFSDQIRFSLNVMQLFSKKKQTNL